MQRQKISYQTLVNLKCTQRVSRCEFPFLVLNKESFLLIIRFVKLLTAAAAVHKEFSTLDIAKEPGVDKLHPLCNRFLLSS